MKTVRGIHLDDKDTCVTLTGDVTKGDTVRYVKDGAERIINAVETIPKWHKIAVTSVKKGENIFKYGAVIGIAVRDIKEGEHVHIHNISSQINQHIFTNKSSVNEI